MTRKQAFAKARRIARKIDDYVFVVFEGGEYDTATDYDLDTFYLGARPIAAIAADGIAEHAN